MLHSENGRMSDNAVVGEVMPLQDLLLAWMSAAESQICSLEVLCAQMPQVNDLLEENMTVLDKSFGTLASHAQAQTENIEGMLKAAMVMSINGSETTLSDELNILKHSIGVDAEPWLIEKIDSIIAAAGEQQALLEGSRKKTSLAADEMVTAVSHAIIGMQFQDRLSQNLVIAEKVAKENVEHLKNFIDMTFDHQVVSESKLNRNGKVGIDIPFAKRLVSMLTLGELQHQFVDHLIAHGFIENGEVVGFSSGPLSSEESEVELF